MTRDKKQRAEKHGRVAEVYASILYHIRGFRVLARRYRTPVGEADLILRRGNLVVVAEVKYVGRGQSVESAIPSPRQIRRIERSALIFQSRHPETAGVMFRFDVVVVRPWGRFHLFTNAGGFY